MNSCEKELTSRLMTWNPSRGTMVQRTNKGVHMLNCKPSIQPEASSRQEEFEQELKQREHMPSVYNFQAISKNKESKMTLRMGPLLHKMKMLVTEARRKGLCSLNIYLVLVNSSNPMVL